MGIETPSGIWELNENWPLSSEYRKEGDDHIRLIKAALLDTFPSINKVISATADEINILDGLLATAAEINYLQGATGNIQDQLEDSSIVKNNKTNTFLNYLQYFSSDVSRTMLRLNDVSGSGNANLALDFTRNGSGNAGAYIQNVNSVSNGYISIVRNTAAGAVAGYINIYEDGNIRIHNAISGTYIDISAAGAITILNGAGFTYNGSNVLIESTGVPKSALTQGTTAFSYAGSPYYSYADINTGFGAASFYWDIVGVSNHSGVIVAIDSAGYSKQIPFGNWDGTVASLAASGIGMPSAPAAGHINCLMHCTTTSASGNICWVARLPQ